MSVNQDTPPEPRKLQPGDQVQVKGGMGPKMIVNEVRCKSDIGCKFWDAGKMEFVEEFFHSDVLAYFGDPVGSPPGYVTVKPDLQFGGGQHGGLPAGAIGIVNSTGHVIIDPLTPVGTVLYPWPSDPRSLDAIRPF
jgi:uncharacterized protein YodC (DUF2158 family)